jgi:hypothetical protein
MVVITTSLYLAIILILLITSIVFWARFMQHGFRAGRLHERHIVTRIICGNRRSDMGVSPARFRPS